MMLWRLLKALIVLAILAAIALVVYAYVGPIFFPEDFDPPLTTVTEEITLPVEGDR